MYKTREIICYKTFLLKYLHVIKHIRMFASSKDKNLKRQRIP